MPVMLLKQALQAVNSIKLCRLFFIIYWIFLTVPVKAAIEVADKPNTSVSNCCLANLNIGVVQKDGKIIVAGDFTTVDNSERFQLARLNADGSLDDTWSTERFNGGDKVPFTKLVVTDDNLLYVAGNFTHFNNQAALNLVRLKADGSLDNTWKAILPHATSPYISEATIYTIALDNAKHLYISGSFKNLDTQMLSFYIVRLNSDGSLDERWLHQVNGVVNNLLIDADDQVYIEGDFTTIDGELHNYSARFNRDGQLDSNWHLPITPRNNNEITLLLGENKFIYVAGTFSEENDLTNYYYLRRFHLNGSLDSSWVPTINGPIKRAAIDEGGDLYLAGQFNGYVMRLSSDGVVSTISPGIVQDFTLSAPMDILVGNRPLAKVVKFAKLRR